MFACACVLCMTLLILTVGHDSLVCAHALTCMCECVSTKPETMSAKHSVSPVSSELSAFIVCRMEFFGGGGCPEHGLCCS